MAKKRSTPQDFLTFAGSSDFKEELSKEDRNLASELYKKNWQTETIDQFEKVMGFVPKTKKPNLKFKNRVFDLDYDKDTTLLGEIMNHPKYSIIYWKDNWTMEGKYKAFIIYSENLDYKTPEVKNNE